MVEFFSSSLGITALVIVILAVIYFMSPKPKNIDTEDEDTHEKQVAVSSVLSTRKERTDGQKDIELVAAIMGALSTYLDVPASKLMIKSIKRVDGNNSVWRERGLE